MGVLKSLNETSEKAIDVGEQYYKKTQEYYKLKVFQQLTLTVGMFCKVLVIGSLLFLAIIFFSVSGTIALAEAIDSTILACVIIGACLGLLGFVVYLLRSKIDTFLIQKIGKNFFDQ